MLPTSDLEFDLPEELIATAPVSPRDAARLLVVSRGDPGRMEHRLVRDLPALLSRGDVLVRNTSRVIPARFRGRNIETGGLVQGLYLRAGDEPGTWVALIKARRHRVGARLRLEHPSGGCAEVELVGRAGDDLSAWVVRGGPIEGVGLPPLPPYILSARARAGLPEDDASDGERYQTVYAREPGSVAAPTAGLHFTPELLGALASAGVGSEEVTLHVGRGTFAPVESVWVEDHPMHAELCSMAPGVLDRLRAATGRVIPVGTTSCRTIESFAGSGRSSGALSTRLLITPGHRWHVTDGLLTNFHLPRSTLLAMVGALFPGGVGRLLEIYREAIRERYRFFSFGDAMLVLP
jgi:S-adenosylmethionine:tRNA ribosyltransferase-isomerase